MKSEDCDTRKKKTERGSEYKTFKKSNNKHI